VVATIRSIALLGIDYFTVNREIIGLVLHNKRLGVSSNAGSSVQFVHFRAVGQQ
jgi:hypothetical protein